ncbi:hypothetical protein CPC08DRAFT_753691 [Agrocybe pediades]|nr:hypothetical protein CPC08DRAFT_753691 [Agrocybe pediades]
MVVVAEEVKIDEGGEEWVRNGQEWSSVIFTCLEPIVSHAVTWKRMQFAIYPLPIHLPLLAASAYAPIVAFWRPKGYIVAIYATVWYSRRLAPSTLEDSTFGWRLCPEWLWSGSLSGRKQRLRRVATRVPNSSNLGILSGDESPTSVPPLGLRLGLKGNSANPDGEVGAMKDPGPGYGPPKEWDVIIENGAIVVFTGILPIFQDEEQHCQKSVMLAIARYTAEQLSSASVALGLFALLAILGVDISLSNLIHTCFVDVPNSRTQKKEVPKRTITTSHAIISSNPEGCENVQHQLEAFRETGHCPSDATHADCI